jgi:hypothetical protein
MKRDDVDRWLGDEDAIVPSSGFASRVMDAVQDEAAAPPAIAFPWKHALPGVAALSVALASILTVGVSSASAPAAGSSELMGLIAGTLTSPATRWTLLALLLTVAPILGSIRLMHRH